MPQRKLFEKVLFLKEAYDFLESLPFKVRRKISSNIDKSQVTMDHELFKKLKDTEIWEFRTLYEGTAYRMLAFWDTRTNALVIATHGFKKKTDKTPKNEIEHAERLMREYFEE